MIKSQATRGLTTTEREQRIAILARSRAPGREATDIACLSRQIAERAAFALVAGKNGVKATMVRISGVWYVGVAA